MASSKGERRSRKRIPVRLPVSITKGPGESASGLTRDLSVSGVFLYTDAPMGENSELEMILLLPPELTHGQKRWVCCQASVVRVEKGAESGQIGIAANIRRMADLPEIPR